MQIGLVIFRVESSEVANLSFIKKNTAGETSNLILYTERLRIDRASKYVLIVIQERVSEKRLIIFKVERNRISD